MDWYHVMLDEHLNILVLVNSLKAYARKIESSEKVPDGALSEMLELIKNFADRCHHGKEERVLFPLLDSKGDGQIVGELIAEHGQARGFVKGMASGNNEDTIRNSRAYVALLTRHIIKENKFFKQGDAKLSDMEKDFLFKEFEKIENEVIGKGMHDKYVERVHKLSEAVLRPLDR
jgi:hemerythrin-like domain-containing protein